MPTETNSLDLPLGQPVPDWTPPLVPPREPVVGRYCRLEPLDPAQHAGFLFTAISHDPQGATWTYLPYGPFASTAEFHEWLHASSRSSDPLYFAIVDLTLKAPSGWASYLRINPAHGSIEVGSIVFSPSLQRTTAATEAMFLMMARAFALGYRRYEWKCNALNAGSRAAAQRLGFSFEGVFRQAMVVKGRNRDTAWYSIIDGEWPALRAAFEQWLDPANFDAAGRQRIPLSSLTGPLIKQRG